MVAVFGFPTALFSYAESFFIIIFFIILFPYLVYIFVDKCLVLAIWDAFVYAFTLFGISELYKKNNSLSVVKNNMRQ